MEPHDLKHLVSLLEERNRMLQDRESELAERNKELLSQKERLTSAIEELANKNNSLGDALSTVKQRNFELDQILYRVSHDLRSPITSIQGILAVMQKEPLSPMLVQLHDFMEQKTIQMQDLLKSLSTLAQASFDRIYYQDVDLEEVIEGCIRDLKYLGNYNRVKISYEIKGDTIFNTDQMLLNIILKSLLSNAFTFREPSTTGAVKVDFVNEKQQMTMSVTDDGEGISKEVEGRIFEMFYRGSGKSTGSGLGLYMVNSIVERLKGRINWSSDPGRTIFKITLPSAILINS